MSKLIQISQLNATPDGTYVNGEVRAVLSRSVAPKNPKAPWKCMLSDSTGVIEASCWGGAINHWEGKQVVLSGKGMKIQEYKGVKTLSVGDKASIAFGGAPGTAAMAEEQVPGDPDPSGYPFREEDVGHAQPAPQRSVAPQAGRMMLGEQPSPKATGMPVHGATVHPATVGMCFKIAADFVLKEDIWSADTPNRIEAMAAQLIERAQRLERGETAEVPF